MEILQFLLSFFLNEYGGGKFAPILNLLKENSFDIKKVMANLNPETVAPIIKDFMNSSKKESPESYSGHSEGLSPIAGIADKDVIYTLNKYFYDTV